MGSKQLQQTYDFPFSEMFPSYYVFVMSIGGLSSGQRLQPGFEVAYRRLTLLYGILIIFSTTLIISVRILNGQYRFNHFKI